MIERPPTVSPQRVTVTSASKRSTVWTNLAEARACRPCAVDDRQLADEGPVGHGAGGQSSSSAGPSGYFPESTREATLMYLRPASWAWEHGVGRGLLVADAGELDQHRQVDAGDHLDGAAVHAGEGQVRGRAAEHVGEDDDALAGVDAARRRP